MKISLQIKIKINSYIKRIIKARRTFIINLDKLAKISIIYYEDLSNNRNLLFESNCFYYLNQNGDVYAHIIDVNFDKILVRNILIILVNLTRRVQLDIVTKYN